MLSCQPSLISNGLANLNAASKKININSEQVEDSLNIGRAELLSRDILNISINVDTVIAELKEFGEVLQKERSEEELNDFYSELVITADGSEICNIKLCMLEQAQLVEELNKSSHKDCSLTEVNKKHFERIEKQLLSSWELSKSNIVDGFTNFITLSHEYLVKEHLLENVAALFSSNPEQVQSYLEQRQEKETGLKDKLVNPWNYYYDPKLAGIVEGYPVRTGDQLLESHQNCTIS